MAEVPHDAQGVYPWDVWEAAMQAELDIRNEVDHPTDIIARAILADRLTRQDPDIRRAALEEALACAKAWRFVPAEFIVPGAMTAEELVIAQRTAKGIEDAIRDLADASARALSQKGDETDGS